LEFIRASSQIIDLDFETAVKAGKIDVDFKKKIKGWGLADSIVLCTARNVKGKVVTGDEHFHGLEEAIMMKNH